MAKETKLKIPLYFQPRGKAYCGAAAAKMVLSFYGKHISLVQIAKELRLGKRRGVKMAALGRWFLLRGFNVTLIAWWRGLPASFTRLAGSALRREEVRWCRRKQNNLRRDLLRFLEAGGIFEPRPVSVQDISKSLKRGIPPILNLNVLRLWKRNGWNGGHFVVPASLGPASMVVNDPNRRYGGRKEYSLTDILHACYSWSGGALFIAPKK